MKLALKLVQHEMLPEQSKVLFPEVVPAPVVAYEPRVETIDLRRGHDLTGAHRAERAQDVNDEGLLQDGQIIGDCCAAHLAGAGETGGFEQASALGHQELEEPLERLPPLQPEQIENVLGPVGIHPLLELPLRKALGQEERGKTAAQETVGNIGLPEVRHVLQDHGRQPNLLFPSDERVAEPG